METESRKRAIAVSIVVAFYGLAGALLAAGSCAAPRGPVAAPVFYPPQGEPAASKGHTAPPAPAPAPDPRKEREARQRKADDDFFWSVVIPSMF